MELNLQPLFSTSRLGCMRACMLSCFSCVWLGDSVDRSLPGSSVHGILQAIILEVAMPSSRGSTRPRVRTSVSCLAGRFFYHLSHQGSPRRLGKEANPLIMWLISLGNQPTALKSHGFHINSGVVGWKGLVRNDKRHLCCSDRLGNSKDFRFARKGTKTKYICLIIIHTITV